MSIRKEKRKSADAFRIILYRMMIWKSKIPTGSNVGQLERRANSRLKMMQPRTTSPYHESFQHFFFFLLFLPKLAWGKLCILTFQRHSVSPPLLGAQQNVSQDPVDEDGHNGSTDQARDGHSHEPRHEDVPEQTPVHCLSRTQPSNCDHRAHLETQPLSDNFLCIFEMLQVMRRKSFHIWTVYQTDCSRSYRPTVSVYLPDHSVWPAYLAVGGGDRQANVRGHYDSHSWGQFNAETTVGELKQHSEHVC